MLMLQESAAATAANNSVDVLSQKEK